jgi:decaprenylphospho-beta-D-ribofuranose 2-oxidase
MLRVKKQILSGWGNVPKELCSQIRPEKYRDIFPHKELPSLQLASIIARGQGKSYGDASLNQDNLVVLTERLNRFLHFDPLEGILTAEAGITLQEILEVIVPQGWFLPVSPGTQFVSLGGCAASDVHGKNHHKIGSFGQYVKSLELINAENQTVICSPNQNQDLFWATIGGMGLTGIIGKITLKLIPITSSSMSVKNYSAKNLEETFDYLSRPQFDDDYSVAWIDTFKERCIIMAAHHHKLDEKLDQKKNTSHSLPFNFASGLLNKTTINLFNTLYYKVQSHKKLVYTSSYQQYFYPLDHIAHWNRLYGKNGFVQYQCVIPEENAYAGIKKILAKKCSSFLAVLKKLGPQNKSLLSFPLQGYTLALDIPYQGHSTQSLLNEFNEIVKENGGRVYLAKDAFLSSEDFKIMYPKFEDFLTIKNKIDPKHVFQSSLSRRLKFHG